MNDALLVRGFERFRDLLRDRERFIDRNRPAFAKSLRRGKATSDALREILAVDELHHERGHASALFQAVDAGYVRVIQRREYFSFALKPHKPIVIGSERGRQNLD